MRQEDLGKFYFSENAIIGYLMVAKVIGHLLHPEYGYFRDELFYIAISDQFSFFNLDLLPLTPLFLKMIILLFGYSIKALHFAAALCGAVSLLLTCLITRELGGKKYAILLTGLLVFFSGFLIFGAIFTYDSLDFLLIVLAIYLLIRILKKEKPKQWIILGFVLGLGLFNKLTILFFGLALFVSLWFVPRRIYFKSKWIWLSAGIALLFSLPYIIWQFFNDWYFLEVAAGYSGGIAYKATFPEFLWNQILPNNIFSFPVWVMGLGFLLFSPKWKPFRLFGFMYIFNFFLFFFIGAKFYFLVPMYTILFAVGSIKIEEFFHSKKNQHPILRTAHIVLPIAYVLFSLPLLPLMVPILPVENLVKYVSVFGVDAGVRTENHQISQLPHHMADRFGWEELVAQTAQLYHKAQSESNQTIGIVTGNWGQASAIHLFGKNYGLPEPISLHGWYYFETRRKQNFRESYISVGLLRENLQNIFEEVMDLGRYTHPYCVPYENNKPFYLCQKPKFDLKSFWLTEKNINPQFQKILNKKGVQAAVTYYYESKAKNPTFLLFSERQMNTLGYEYLYKGKIKDAIDLFRLNVEVYPASSNVYDSLGEGYMENGEYEKAILNYKKSLELNPNNSNGKEKLREMERLKHNITSK